MTTQNRIKAIRLASRLENDKKMKEIIEVKIVDKEEIKKEKKYQKNVDWTRHLLDRI